MIIDMSQAAVNRTAMFYISHHVYRLLEPIRSGCQFFGQTFDAIPSPPVLRAMQDRAFGLAFSNPSALMDNRGAMAPRKDASTLYLDPLYVLFGDLKPHDTVFVLDLSTVTAPQWHGEGVEKAYDAAFSLICSRQPNVVAISQNTADTFYANYAFPPERTSVLHLYVPFHLIEEAAGEPFHSPDPYVLFVGSLEMRKNVIGAIESFRISSLGDRGYRLIIAGGIGHGGDEIRRAAAKVRNVFFTGYASEQDLCALYRGASAFIYPSYLEGFGVPLLESMFFGIPAVSTMTGACPEVGGDLMHYLDPDDHVGFARELVRLVGLGEIERAAYAKAARKRVDDHFSIGRFDTSLRAMFSAPG